MKRFLFRLGAAFLLLALGIAPVTATGSRQQPVRTASPISLADAVPIPGVGKYATGFTAARVGEVTVLTVTRPWKGAGPDNRFTYVLYPRDGEPPAGIEADLVLGVPISGVITMSTTLLPHLEALGVLDTLVGVDSLSWVYSPAVHSRASALVQIGSGPMVDVELALVTDPEAIMLNSYGGEWDAQPTLEAAGLPVVVTADWAELHPLAPAEWLLFTAAFYGRLEEAKAIFAGIEREYQRLASLASAVSSRPTVLVNAPYQGTWAVSGGGSYAAAFIRDAGGRYVWADDGSEGSLFYDMESVYEQAGDAEVWINPGVWGSLAEGRAEDSRFEAFAAFKAGEVYNNNRRLGPGGGNDYFESGSLNPHRILADLIAIFHPQLLPGHAFHYYQKLR